MSKIQRSVIPAAPGWFVVMVDEGMRATVQPVGAWQVVVDATTSFDDPTLTVEPLIPGGRHGRDVLSAPPNYAATAVFGPGQNPLPWAAEVEGWGGERLAAWDLTNWMPSQAPVFATADETLWTDDFIPPDAADSEAAAEAGWG